MENGNLYQPVPRRSFTTAETVLAWIFILAGYAFWRVTPVNAHPFGGFLLLIALYVITIIMLMRRGMRLRGGSLAVFLSAVALLSTLLLCSNSMIHTFSYIYGLAVYLYMIYAISGNHLCEGFSNLILADFCRALFVFPFVSLGKIFDALGSRKGKRGGTVLLKILLGAVIAVVPTAVVVVFLSYDEGFVKLLDNLFQFEWVDLFSHIGSLIWGFPIAMYLYGAYISAVDRKCLNSLTKETCVKAWRCVKVLPVITAAVAVLPILILYVVFFMSQWPYYVSGFLGQLPAQTVYSQYARDGFFQLCSVSVLNFVILSVLSLFTARKRDGSSRVIRVLFVVLSLFTLILISTAVAKMVMYIDCYGLTQKRVYATWFMAVLAILFLFVILHQFFPKFKLLPIGMIACVVLYAVLGFSGVDSFIARYNIDRYLSGSLKTVDVQALEELGDSAVPELVHLIEVLDERLALDIADYNSDDYFFTEEGLLYQQVAQVLYTNATADKNTDLFAFTIPRARAKTALKRAGIIPKDEAVGLSL